jgi:hypothetical protein
VFSSKRQTSTDPAWWSVQHTLFWEERRPELRRALRHRTDAEGEAARLGPDDALVQEHPTTPRNVSVDGSYNVPDDSWEVGIVWEQLEPALRFGSGASVHYSRFETWNEELEVLLRQDWDATRGPGTWQRMKRAIRRAFEAGRSRRS